MTYHDVDYSLEPEKPRAHLHPESLSQWDVSVCEALK